MSLSPAFLDDLRARIRLSDLVARDARLIRAGREFKACCPFHDEKTPSFTVNDEKGFYHCFGCGAHGDAIRWLTDQRGLSFIDAVKELAAQAGVELPAPDPRAGRIADQRATLHDVMAAAQDWFVANLAAPTGAAARAYLARRGFDGGTVARFGFGYAPDNAQALKAALAQFAEPLLIEAGLRVVSDEREPYDRFRGRLMLPIADARGRTIAFGGRVLEAAPGAKRDGAPKYLNSPETPLFDKGATLYNLHRAAPAARETGRLIVVEGYMDVIALAAVGIADAVAPLGTALTDRQLQLLWRHAESPVVCFDGDAAGRRAAMRAIGRALPLLAPARSLRIATLPDGLDPDDVVRRGGAGAMTRLAAEAPPLVEALWHHERDAAPLATPEDKAGLKARLFAQVDTIADRDVRALYRRALGDRFSAEAFPPRVFEPRTSPAPGFGAGGKGFSGRGGRPPERPSADTGMRLRRASTGGARESLVAAIVAGLLRHPVEIARHAETLARVAGGDARLAALLGALDAGVALESAALGAILTARELEVPAPADYARLRFGFLDDRAAPEQARAELGQAIVWLVDRPALEAALARSTYRFDEDLSADEYAAAWGEQQRLLKRKLELDARLRQTAATLAQGPGPHGSGTPPTTNTAE